MHHPRTSKPPRAAVLAILVLTTALLLSLSVRSETPNGLQQAWTRAREAGSYRFTADVEQTLLPRPIPSMVGQSDQRVDLRIEGQVTLPDYGELRLRFEGASSTDANSQPLTIVQEAGQTYLLRDGERVPLDNPAALAAPAADYMGYLAGAENVRQLPDAGDGLTRYAFDVNGSRFAEYVRQQWEAQRRSSDAAPLPPGVDLQPPALLKRMTGQGELWVGADGLPVRQVIDLAIPKASAEYDARVHLSVDFDFSPAGSAALLRVRASGVVDGLRQTLASSLHSDLRRCVAECVCLIVVTVFAAALVTWRRRRAVGAVVLVSMTALLMLSPVLETLGVVHYYDRQARALSVESVMAQALGQPEAASKSNTLSPEPLVETRAPTSRCGDGTPGVDSDSDGLLDVTEYCLGTDPFQVDTDHDMIPDTLEVNGFDYNGQHWPGNPLEADCNRDGLADGLEWPEPVGTAPSIDVDGDGVPNLWDRDNDNDGVPDNLDLSPFSRSALVSDFSVQITGGTTTGYDYVEVQLRPNNPDHLRYTTSYLDWPHDEKGQVQDLDDSPNDIQLIPLLEILATRAPEEELARKYGVTVFGNTGDSMYPYRLVVPLAAVGDGGQMVAWYTKFAFGPSPLNTILRQGRIIWVVQVQVDQWLSGRFVRQDVPVQTYLEPSFQVTGMQVTRSEGFESMVLGTPSTPQDDRQLFNLLLGMSSTFLNHDTPDLATVEQRFTNPATPSEEKWGVTATVAVDHAEYSHRDAGLAGTSERIGRFLDDRGYSAHAPFNSLLVAFEEQAATWNIDQRGLLEVSEDFWLSASWLHIATTRGLKLSLYREDGGWQELTFGQALPPLKERYADLSALLADLQVTYPELSEADLRGMLYMFYSTWTIGQSRVIAIDGTLLPPASEGDAAVYERYFRADVPSLPAYLMDVANLGQAGEGLRIGSDPNEVWTYVREYGQIADELGFYEKVVQFLGIDDKITGNDAKAIVGSAIKLFKITLGLKTAVQAINWANSAIGSWKGLMNPTTMSGTSGRLLGAIGCAVSVGIIWLQFGISTDFSDPIALRSALVYAIVATVITIVLFVISLNPVGAILVAIFAVVDLIVYIATWLALGEGISIQEEMIKAIAEFFYSADVMTWLDGIEFSDLEAIKPDGGLLEGCTFIIRDSFSGTILADPEATYEELAASDVKGWLNGGGTYEANWSKNTGTRICTFTADGMICRNDTSVTYTFPLARRNARLEVESKVHAETIYRESTLGGLVTWDKMQTFDLPEEDSEPIVIYLDILPTSIGGFWNWADVDNSDEDGDGLLRSEELALGSRAAMWDSDCDGLSDQFEFEQRGSYGTKPLHSDADSDKLPDGLEYRIGTRIDQADSDGDGMTDGEEVYHQNHWLYSMWDVCNDVPLLWEGGWWITLPGRADPVWVLSDPGRSDADGDGLNDASEKLNGTSPYAYNDAPRLTLEASPLAMSPLGAEGVWLESGSSVVMTATLYNTLPQPISTTLTLCLPDFVTDVVSGTMTGARSPVPTPAADCSGLAWSFADANALQRWEQVQVVVTGTLSSAASDRGEMVVRVPYIDLLGEEAALSTIVPIVVDREDPSVTVVSPAEGALLGRGTHAWVVGGAAGDDSSWVTHVDVDLPGAGTVTAEGTDAWATTWSIPGDGVYAITAHSFDYLGHVSTPSTVNLRVDNTPPQVSLTLAPGAILSGQGGQEIVVQLNGTATDNLSGLVRVQISLDGRPWREVWADAGTPLLLDWSLDWRLPDADSAQGWHTVALRAFDLAGNIGDPVERSVLVDVLPPSSELTRAWDVADPPRVVAGQAVTITGVANDTGYAPLPARPAELVGTVDSIISATIWLSPNAVKDNDEGVQVAWLGDVNGDRLADLAVGLPGATAGGRVVIVYGRTGDWPIPPEREALSNSPSSFVGRSLSRPAGFKLGYTVAAAGDVNGDGLSDLLLGDRAANEVYVIFGSTGWFGRDVTLDGPRPAVWSVLKAPGANVGQWFGPAGDVNGDGYDDLLIGATTGSGGTAYLLLGQPNPWWDNVDLTVQAAARVDIGSDGARLCGVGDRDNDELDEFAVGDNHKVYILPGKSYAPRSGEWLSLTAGDVTTFDSADVQPAIAALGDVDGDNRPDLIYSNGATPRLVRGNGATADILKAPAASGFLAAPGDVDADGKDDILVGNANNDAYLILNNLARTVTIHGVATGGSAPYAAGADLNSDRSSDLLVVPHPAHASEVGMASAGFGPLPSVASGALPRAESSTSTAPVATRVAALGADGAQVTALAVTRHVDDDYCSACSNDGYVWGSTAFASIASAISAASAGDTISVLPGAYGAFNANKDNLVISGVHADAVFVDGGGEAYAAQVQNALGVTIENLTLRNAQTGIYLDHAGLGGAADTAKRTTLRALLVYSVTSHALDMDPKSTVSLTRATLVSDYAAARINVRAPEDAVLPLGQLATSSAPAATDGLLQYSTGGSDFLFALAGTRLYRCPVNGGAWQQLHVTPYGEWVGDGLVSHDGELYAMFIETIIGSPPVLVPHWYRWSSGGWTERAQPTAELNLEELQGGRLASASGYAWFMTGGWWPELYRYDDATNTWTLWEARQAALDFTNEDRSMVGVGNTLYMQARYQPGPGFPADAERYIFAYDTVAKTLTKLAPIPGAVDPTMPLVWDGDHYIYGVPAGTNVPLLRYDIDLGSDAGAWHNLGTLNATVGWAARLARFGSVFYVAIGGGSTIYTFPPQSLRIDRTAFVADPTLATAAWLALDSGVHGEAFGVAVNNSDWAAGSGTSWSPTALNWPVTWEEARFADADRDVYRVGSGSALISGYHTYRTPATVSAPGKGGEFSQIQSAINSGANLVLIGPGAYPQPFYLLSGVAVVGSGAELTEIGPPTGNTRPALVTAEGVVGAHLAGITLAGDGVVDGLRAENGAKWTRVSRCIIRGTHTGILVSGSTTALEVVNNTIAANGTGMQAAGSPLDVRNTIFAYNSTRGLDFSTAVSPISHEYNDYWTNGANLLPNTPSASEKLIDPLLTQPSTNNYRLLDNSPMIDAGNPTDPVPPGAGNRVDIGYHELGRAAFYVDDDYCQYCLNDGLTWGADAFDVINDAMSRVRQVASALGGAVPEGGYSVGVNPGLYQERVSVPSYVRLIGRSSADTIILGGGTGSPVTFDGVVQAKVSNLTLWLGPSAGGSVHVTGGSNAITITRNELVQSGSGVLVDGRASATVLFNTITENGQNGVLCSDAGSWARVRNNILLDDNVGLRTASGGSIYNDYNLLWDNAGGNYVDGAGSGLAQGPHELLADPDLGAGSMISADSPAVDRADPQADVPLGGGARADIGLWEVLVTPITILPGQMDVSTASGTSGVHQVQVGVVSVSDPTLPCTDTLPTAGGWVTLADLNGETADYWQTVYTPTLNSLYRLYSRASDVAGNQETDPLAWCDGAWVADSAAPVVELLQPPAAYSGPAPLELRGQASDYDATGEFSVQSVYVTVDGKAYPAEWAAEPWQPDAGSARKRPFRTWVALANGSHAVQAWAQDRAGNLGSSAARTINVTSQAALDSTQPDLSVVSPAAGGWVTPTVFFSGTAADTESGLASVEVSLDGGVKWTPATVSGGNWSLTWESDVSGELISFPARVRARDRAGNSRVQALVITIDAQCPSGPEVEAFSTPPGYHWDSDFAQWYTLTLPRDASGTAQALLTYDQSPDTVPSTEITVVPGEVRRIDSAGIGDWYLHLGARDAAGNLCYKNYGPWHVGRFGGGVAWDCPDWRQSIILDGLVDVSNNEWSTAYELMDDDERSGRAQSLYFTFDGLGLYLAWQGAQWATDGSMWAYLSTGGVGSTTPVSGTGTTLPFAANYAVEINGPDDGRLWHYNGSWTSGALEFALGTSAGSEVRIPLSLPWDTPVKLLAFAVDDAGAVWSVFPTTNALAGPWTAAYNWSRICTATAPNQNQPRAVGVVMSLSSPQPSGVPYGPTQSLTYIVTLQNLESENVGTLQLTLDASSGLTYVGTPTGATCADCSLNNHWLLNVPTLAVGATRVVTVTGRLGTAAVLAPLFEVTTTAGLLWNSAAQASATLSQRVDGSGPALSIYSRPGAVAATGVYTIYGTADDGAGAGVGQVQVRLGAGAWQPADGAGFWSAELAMPGSGSVQLQAQGADNWGTLGPVATLTLVVDTTAPTVTLNVPAALTGTSTVLTGSTRDPAPAGALVSTVDVQLDADTAAWLPGTGPYAPDAHGLAGWSWTWSLPHEDGVTHTLRARAVDGVGNTTVTAWMTTTVDSIPPSLSIDSDLNAMPIPTYLWPAAPAFVTGTVSDGGGVQEVRVTLGRPDGSSFEANATVSGTQWSLLNPAAGWAPGDYRVTVVASDVYGNIARLGPLDAQARLDAGASLYVLGYEVINNPLTFLLRFNLMPTLGYTPTGGVQFDLDGVPLGVPAPIQISTWGEILAQTDIAGLPIGTYTVTATYAGDDQFVPLTRLRGLNITDRREVWEMTLASSHNPSYLGQPITLTAVVDSGIMGVPATGTVQFHADGLPLGAPAALTGGLPTARLNVDWLAVATHPISATFSGDNLFKPMTVTLSADQVVIGEADLQVTKQAEPAAVAPQPGAVLTYTLTYANAGPSAAPDVYVTDTLPGGVSFGQVLSAPAGWGAPTLSGNQLTWYTPSLQSGTTGTLVFTAMLDRAQDVGLDWALTNTVQITGSYESDASDNQDVAVSALQGLQVSKRHAPEPVTAAWDFTYYIDITNTASTPATNVVISDTLPVGVAPYAVQPSPGGVFDGVNTVTWLIPSIGPGFQQQVWIKARTYQAQGGNCLTNHVWVDSEQVAPPVSASDDLCVRAAEPVEPTPTPTPMPTPTPLPGTVVTLQAGVGDDNPDTVIYQYSPDANYALDGQLRVGYKRTYAALMRIDVSPIPPGASIEEAWLEVYALSWSGSNANIALGAYAVSTTVRLDEATWNWAQDGQPWAAPGCNDTLSDRRAQAQAQLTTAGPRCWYRFDLRGLVQDWVNGTLPNNGVLLRQLDNAAYSFVFAGSDYSQVDLRPRLVVRYQ